MTDPDLSAAVERAAEALAQHDACLTVWPSDRKRATAALTAALPVIEQMHRAAHAEEFADALAAFNIDTDPVPRGIDVPDDYERGMHNAAALVRSLAAAKETTTDA